MECAHRIQLRTFGARINTFQRQTSKHQVIWLKASGATSKFQVCLNALKLSFLTWWSFKQWTKYFTNLEYFVSITAVQPATVLDDCQLLDEHDETWDYNFEEHNQVWASFCHFQKNFPKKNSYCALWPFLEFNPFCSQPYWF